MLRYIVLLLVLCAVAQTQALNVYARAALPSSEEIDEEEPSAEGRVFSIIRDSDRDHPPRYPHYHDDRPIIIQPPPQQPSYPAPSYPPPQYPSHPPPPYPHPYPQPYPQPYPFPVPVHHPHPPPPTIIKPIIRPHYPRPRPHHHYGSGFSGYGFPPFINITYSPVLTSGTTSTGGTTSGGTTTGDITDGTRSGLDQQQLNYLTQLSQQLLAQSIGSQPQLLQYSSPVAAVAPNSLIYQQQPQQYYAPPTSQLIAINLDETQEELDEVEPTRPKTKPKRQQYTVRRSQKSKKKNKKNRNHTKLVYLALEPEAEAQAQSTVMEPLA
ncbi:E1A-binding protein p400-like [Drosophila virilis]|uniref:E1A-binding protein p400-like n=1 Tax=Drosophila virilis TaxID=7244 RepID=UPI00017D5D2F